MLPLRIVAVALLSLSAVAQDTTVFRGGVSLVHVDTEVLHDGRIVSGLTKDDFRVLDEGKPQPIVTFSAEEQPLDLILLFDISGSMRPQVKAVAAAARQGLAELRTGDRVSVMVFNTRSRVLAGFTEDLDAVRQTLEEDLMALKFRGGTLIQTAVDDAAKIFLHQPRTQRRRAVLIVTDNIGIRTRSEDTVVRNFWEADAILSGLIVRNRPFRTAHTIGLVMSPPMLFAQAGMKGVAAKTGGDAMQSADPGSAFQESMRRIRARYSLYYAQPEADPGKRRQVKVELTGGAAANYPKAQIRARTGYYVPGR
jgi:Ca-activated chloride channel family protein